MACHSAHISYNFCSVWCVFLVLKHTLGVSCCVLLYSTCGWRASHGDGSPVGVPDHRISCWCNTWAYLLCGTWNLSGSGIQSLCPLHWLVDSEPLDPKVSVIASLIWLLVLGSFLGWDLSEHSFVFSRAIWSCPPLFPSSNTGHLPTWGTHLSVSYLFAFFLQLMGFPQQEYWSGLPLPPAVDHLLSELFTMTCLFWVTLHEKAHSLTELCPPLHHTSSGPWSRYSLLINCYGSIFCQQLELMETNILTLETMVWLLKAFRAHLAYSECWQGTWPVPYPIFSVTPAAFQVHPAFLILSSVQLIHSVMSDSLRSHEPEHARPPCPSATPGVHPNPCPLSRWCHPNISSSVVPVSSCPQSFPASGSFPMSQLFTRWPKYWSLSLSIAPSSEHSALISFRMDWLYRLAVQGTLKSLLQHHS